MKNFAMDSFLAGVAVGLAVGLVVFYVLTPFLPFAQGR